MLMSERIKISQINEKNAEKTFSPFSAWIFLQATLPTREEINVFYHQLGEKIAVLPSSSWPVGAALFKAYWETTDPGVEIILPEAPTLAFASKPEEHTGQLINIGQIQIVKKTEDS
jgi:hypothetical protein